MINTTLNFFDKFSNRELAITIWILVGIVWALSQQKIRKSLFQLIITFFAWKLTISYVLMFLYIALIIFILKSVRLWGLADLQITIIWVLCTAFVMLFEFSKANDENFFKTAIKDNVKGLIILEFLINLYVFDLWVELLLVPLLGLLGGMMAVAESDKKYDIVNKALNSFIALFGLSVTGYAIYMVITDFKHFATLETIETFYLPILLTIMFLPFVYFTALYVCYESLFLRLRFFVKDSILLKYAKKKTILTFGPNLTLLNKWAQHITTLQFKDKEEINDAVRDFRKAQS